MLTNLSGSHNNDVHVGGLLVIWNPLTRVFRGETSPCFEEKEDNGIVMFGGTSRSFAWCLAWIQEDRLLNHAELDEL